MSQNTDKCIVVAVFTPLESYRDDIRNLLARVTPTVHDEPGCEFYTMNEDVDGRFVHIEGWTTRQHWVEHMSKPSVKEILKGVKGKLSRDVEVYEMYNVYTGTSGKGSLSPSSARS